MARVTFTIDDILKSKLVTPGWYKIKVKSHEQQQAGTDGSDLYVYELEINQPGTPFHGVLIRHQLSEKAIGMGIEFFESCGYEIKAGIALETDKVVGKECECYIQRGEYKGRGKNEPASFRKLKAA